MFSSDTTIYPDTALVVQKLYRSPINYIQNELESSLSAISFSGIIKPGQTVAIAVGSRGIDNIDSVVYSCARFLENIGLKPFLVPAMGSHGGASAEGQKKVLKKLKISESSIGIPVHSEMETQIIGRLSCGLNINISKEALSADHIVIINRIKPHTKFRADIESGLCKMLTIGLGKAEGASVFHNFAVKHGFGVIEEAADFLINKLNILFGIALLEDGYGNLSKIEAVLPHNIINREKELLKQASNMMGRIPFDFLDLLIIDYFGKDISGIGMDSNITGRHRDIVGDFCTSPHAKRIFVRDLSSGSDGNGNGIGLADITTTRLVKGLDMDKTYTNAIAAISPEKAAIPIHFDSDRKCLEVCAKTLGLESLQNARIARISDTKHLNLIQVSKALEEEIESNQNLERVSDWEPIKFDGNDNLTSFSY